MPIMLAFLLQAAEPAARPADAAELARALGIPVAEAEARMRIADRLGIFQLRAANDPDFAGAYLEHEPNVQAVVMFKGDADAKLRRYGTEGAGFVARSAQWSLAELASAKADAEKAFKEARLAPAGIGIDVEANRAVAYFADTARAAQLKLPAAVAIEAVEGEIAREPQSAGPVEQFPQAREIAPMGGQAVITGTLFVRDGCLRIGEEAGASHLVLWPATAKLSAEGDKVSVENDGATLTAGSTATLSGTASENAPPPGWLIAPVTPKCEGPYWIASASW